MTALEQLAAAVKAGRVADIVIRPANIPPGITHPATVRWMPGPISGDYDSPHGEWQVLPAIVREVFAVRTDPWEPAAGVVSVYYGLNGAFRDLAAALDEAEAQNVEADDALNNYLRETRP